MPSRTRKFRGSRTHGRGKKKGRGAGLMGGRGNAGLHKHKVMRMLKYAPDHFGRHGFKRPQKVAYAKISMNIGEILERMEDLVRNGIAVKKGDKITVNLSEIGIDKLLGSGIATSKLEIIVSEASETAKQKIEAAGGSITQP
ncbi:MAG: uL15 family ribosomal protein [Methanomassiliicoccales archaeon]|jgi:large subunit ribosomal protein L15